MTLCMVGIKCLLCVGVSCTLLKHLSNRVLRYRKEKPAIKAGFFMG